MGLAAFGFLNPLLAACWLGNPRPHCGYRRYAYAWRKRLLPCIGTQLRELTSEAQRLKVIAEQAGDYRAALAPVRELCRIVELMAKLSGELDSISLFCAAESPNRFPGFINTSFGKKSISDGVASTG